LSPFDVPAEKEIGRANGLHGIGSAQDEVGGLVLAYLPNSVQTIVARVERFLVVSKPNAYCIPCIALSLGLDDAAADTALRGHRSFDHRLSDCSLCGFTRPTLSARSAGP
jgi:hypothetical protein